MPIEVAITTPEGLVHKGQAKKVVLPAHDGELGVLPRHAPLIGKLGVGELRVSPAEGGGDLSIFVQGGFVEILENRVTVLAARAELTSTIDPAAAEREAMEIENEAPPEKPGIEARAARAERISAAKKRARAARRASGTR